MSCQQTDRRTERVRACTLYIHTPVSNEPLMQNAITSNCLSGKKEEETVWHEMTAGSTVLTQEEVVDIY